MQAGRHWRFRRVTARSIGASGRRFPPFFDGGCELSRAATHVDACDGVFSDAGSTPAASTIFPREFEALASFSRRLHYFSTRLRPICRRRLQKSDRRFDRRRAQVHVTLRRPEILMAGELLDGSYGRATHRQVRTEGVPQDVDARLHVRASCRPSQHHLHNLLRKRLWINVRHRRRGIQRSSCRLRPAGLRHRRRQKCTCVLRRHCWHRGCSLVRRRWRRFRGGYSVPNGAVHPGVQRTTCGERTRAGRQNPA